MIHSYDCDTTPSAKLQEYVLRKYQLDINRLWKSGPDRPNCHTLHIEKVDYYSTFRINELLSKLRTLGIHLEEGPNSLYLSETHNRPYRVYIHDTTPDQILGLLLLAE